MRVLGFFLLLGLISCESTQKEQEKSGDLLPEKEAESFANKKFEERWELEVREKLAASANEQINFKIYWEHLNSDGVKDAIITANRLSKAMEEATKAANPAKKAELGYLGPHNFFFFYDGKKDKISVPVVISSSAKSPLEVKFENIQGSAIKDILVEYKIRNGKFRNYYFLAGDDLLTVFECLVYDRIGQEDYEANFFEYKEGTFCLVKDIDIYAGKIKNYSTGVSDYYSYKPEIQKTNKQKYRFYFDPERGKYVTDAKPNL